VAEPYIEPLTRWIAFATRILRGTGASGIMDSYKLNKIAGAALSALLFAFGAKTFAEIALHEKAPAKPGFELPKSAAVGGAATASGAAFDAKKVVTCHTVQKGGENKVGPNLYGIVGRKVGQHAGFNYSDAIKGKGGEWTWDALATYINNPRTAIPGNKMAFAGVTDDADLADMLAYMRTLADSPAELPK
jgi:cytochrome c